MLTTPHATSCKFTLNGLPDFRAFLSLAGTVLSVVLIVVQPTAALTIYGHHTDEGENPSWDPDGQILKDHFEAAKDIWEEVLYHPTMVRHINFEWDNDIGSLGLWTPWSSPENNKIEINPDFDWFHDAPFHNNDFDFTNPGGIPDPPDQGQTLYWNLSPGEKNTLFPGTQPPPVLEVGYNGKATTAAAENSYDLLSVLLHEIGHDLGIGWLEPGEYNVYGAHVGGLLNVLIKENPQEPPNWGHLDDGNSTGWLMGEDGQKKGTRKLPSATDVLVIAEERDLLDHPNAEVKLKRVDRISGGSWQDPLGWIGGRVADFQQEVSVRHSGDPVWLSADASAKTLMVGNQLATNSHTLEVREGTAHVSGDLIVNTGGRAEIYGNLLIHGGQLAMVGGLARVEGTLSVENYSSWIGKIRGFGTVDIFERLINNGEIQAEDGTLKIRYASFSPEILDLDGDHTTEIGVVRAEHGNIEFDALLTDAFDGTMWIHSNHTITMNHAWTHSGALHLNPDNGSAVPATLNGGQHITVDGWIQTRGVGVIDAPITFKPQADVIVEHATSQLNLQGMTIYEGGSYTGDGALRQMAYASVKGITSIDTAVYDWDGDEGSPSTTQINPFILFTINSHRIELPGTDGHDGVIWNRGGMLEVNTMWFDPANNTSGRAPWRLDPGGRLILENSGIILREETGVGARVFGSPIDAAGTIVARREDNYIKSDVTFRITADVQVPEQDDELYLGRELYLVDGSWGFGEVEYQGGSYTGHGTIHQYKNATFVDDTSIEVDTYNWDGSEGKPSTTTILAGAKVWLHNRNIDVGDNDYNGTTRIHAGTLIVNTWTTSPPSSFIVPAPWRLGPLGLLDLYDYSVVSGSSNPNFPTQEFSPMHVAGHIKAAGPGNRIYSTTVFEPTAQVTLAEDAYLYLHGETTYQGGLFNGPGTLTQTGDAVVEQPTGVYVDRFDMDGGTEITTWTLENNLFIQTGFLDLYDNIFDGRIVASQNATMNINLLSAMNRWEMAGTIDVSGNAPTTYSLNGSPVEISGTVNVAPGNTAIFNAHVSGKGTFTGDKGSVQFLGGYSPGTSPAVVDFEGDVLLGPLNTLLMEIGDGENNASSFAHDQLRIAGRMTLGGTLRLEALGRMQPGGSPWGDATRTLITAAGGMQGDFSQKPGSGRHLGYGLFLTDQGANGQAVTYATDADGEITAMKVDLFQAAPGDADGSRRFDHVDLDQVQQSSQYRDGLLTNSDWTTGDWTGDKEFDALDIMAAQEHGLFDEPGVYDEQPPGEHSGDERVSIIYNADNGEVSVLARGNKITSLRIESFIPIFVNHEDASGITGHFDYATRAEIFKNMFGNNFEDMSFGMVAYPGLPEDWIAHSINVSGSIAPAGALGGADIIYIPEPSTLALLLAAVLTAVLTAVTRSARHAVHRMPERTHRHPAGRDG